MDKVVPEIPAKTPKMRYKVPISLWLVENTQRVTNPPMFLYLFL